MLKLESGIRIFISLGATDMRKSIRGLSLSVAQILKRDPRCGHIFAFCNKRRKMAKILVYDGLGFWLFQRTLERERFRWPEVEPNQTVVELDAEQLMWLLSGLDWLGLSFQTKDSSRTELPKPEFLKLL